MVISFANPSHLSDSDRLFLATRDQARQATSYNSYCRAAHAAQHRPLWLPRRWNRTLASKRQDSICCSRCSRVWCSRSWGSEWMIRTPKIRLTTP